MSGSEMSEGIRRRRSPRPTVWAGIVVLLASGLAAVTLAIEGQPEGSPYPAGLWVVLAGVVVVGLALVSRLGDAVRSSAAAVGVVLSMQLIGAGIYAIKRWRVQVLRPLLTVNTGLVRGLAVAMAAAMLASSVTCLVVLIRSDGFPARTTRAMRTTAAAVGLITILGLPWAVGFGGTDTTDLTSIGAYALLYSVPWGVGLVGVGWLDRSPAMAILVAIVVSGIATLLFTADGIPIAIGNVVTGFAASVAAVLAVAIVRFRSGRGSPA